ncbi:uncharacterized protein [Saccopteryx bilineata]|uniref:uncharacterized protein n=1 Tax=Saccopteryx bilineata TaxID=59482 RepID=UPI00338DDD4D
MSSSVVSHSRLVLAPLGSPPHLPRGIAYPLPQPAVTASASAKLAHTRCFHEATGSAAEEFWGNGKQTLPVTEESLVFTQLEAREFRAYKWGPFCKLVAHFCVLRTQVIGRRVGPQTSQVFSLKISRFLFRKDEIGYVSCWKPLSRPVLEKLLRKYKSSTRLVPGGWELFAFHWEDPATGQRDSTLGLGSCKCSITPLPSLGRPLLLTSSGSLHRTLDVSSSRTWVTCCWVTRLPRICSRDGQATASSREELTQGLKEEGPDLQKSMEPYIRKEYS